jgi:DNA polymerase III subunit delta'
VMRFGALDDAAMTSVLQDRLAEANDTEIAALVRAGAGSPGRALGYAGLDIAGIEQSLTQLAETGDPTNAVRAGLAQKLSLKAAAPRYQAFLNSVPSFIARTARHRQGAALERGLDAWSQAQKLIASASTQNIDPQSAVFELAGYVAALAPGAGSAKA